MIAANRSRSSCSLEEALAGLRAEWGIQARPVAALVRLLDGGAPVSTGRLVAETALSHRSVTEILQRLEPWLETGPQGHRLKQKPPSPPDPPHEIRTPGHPQRSEEGGVPRFHGEGEGRGGGDPDLERRLAQLQVPRRRRHLDHVAATSDTRLRRARLLAERYDLDGAGVLCLGDHDLTSLALALVAPRAHVAVVDVDDEVLEHVDRSARALGVEVCCRFADLRLGLPSDLRGTADLVFTDPPYTPEGVWLFAARGIEAMRRDHRSRLLLCYGHGDGQPALGLKVQAALHSLRLLIEEVRPGFNRYDGAHAIGSASALYVTRPGPGAWRAAERRPEVVARIYTHGPMAVEARDRPLPDSLTPELPDPMPAAELWRLSERHAGARPERRPRLPETAAVDLSLEPALGPRLLLVHRGHRLRLALPGAAAAALLAPDGWLAAFFGASHRLRLVASEGGLAVVEAERRDDPVDGAELLARRLASHPAAAVASSLREGLIAAGAARTKNEARTLVEGTPGAAARPADLPLHVLRAVAESLQSLAGGTDTQTV